MRDCVSILDIDDLAQMCFECLPWLQYRQWILENDANEQTHLIKLRLSMSRQCERVLQSVIRKDNLQAFELLLPKSILSNWSFLVLEASPRMLQFALQNARDVPSCYMLTLPRSPFENFKLICTTFGIGPWLRETLIFDILYHIEHSSTFNRDIQCLDWMLNEMQWHASIGFVIPFTDPNILSVLKPSILAKRIAFQDETCLPIEYFQFVPLCEERRKQYFKVAMVNKKWEKAAFFWMPDFQFDHHFDIKIFSKWKKFTSFNTNALPWQRDPRRVPHEDIALCENALSFQGPGDFCTALLQYFTNWIGSFSNSKIKVMFEQCVFFGLPHLAQVIWNIAPNMHITFLQVLQNGSKSCNLQMLEFAYDKLRAAGVWHEYEWHEHAIQSNNVVLWQFLLDKPILRKANCFDIFLARNHVDFVRLVWPEIHAEYKQVQAPFLRLAFQSQNTPLLSFLSIQSEFAMDDKTAIEHLEFLSQQGLVSIITHIKSLPLQNVLNASYHKAKNLVTMGALHTRFGSIMFAKTDICNWIQHHIDKDDFTERSLFFLNNNFFTLAELFDTMPTSTQKDDLMGRVYCDF